MHSDICTVVLSQKDQYFHIDDVCTISVFLENSIKSISFVTDSKYTKIQIAVLTGNAKVLYSQLLIHSLTQNPF